MAPNFESELMEKVLGEFSPGPFDPVRDVDSLPLARVCRDLEPLLLFPELEADDPTRHRLLLFAGLAVVRVLLRDLLRFRLLLLLRLRLKIKARFFVSSS